MQVVHEKVKDLFILFNKWGRIGEYDEGQYQRTPFRNLADAIAEWSKIFKSKTSVEQYSTKYLGTYWTEN